MKTRSAKQKGRTGQQEIVDILRGYFKFSDEDCYSRPSSVTGDDIVLSPTARKDFPFSVEVKRTEKLAVWKALTQAEENSGDNLPLLIFRRNRGKWYVALDLDHFLTTCVMANKAFGELLEYVKNK